MIKKLRIIILTVAALTLLGGCATVEYMHSQENTGVITRQYTVHLDEKQLLDGYGIKIDDMKEFLFGFFGKVMGRDLTVSELKAESLRVDGRGELEGLTQYLAYNAQGKYVAFAQKFDSEKVFYRYFGTESGDGGDERVIEKGFFFYRVTEELELPFRLVKEAVNATDPSELGGSGSVASMFMFGDGTQEGFKGFRATFSEVKPEDADKLLYRFVLGTPGKGYSSPEAKYKETTTNVSYLIWEMDADGAANKVTLVRQVPNPAGWYLLAIILAALFGGGLVLFWVLYRKSHPKIPPSGPAPVKTPPPAVFGEEYR